MVDFLSDTQQDSGVNMKPEILNVVLVDKVVEPEKPGFSCSTQELQKYLFVLENKTNDSLTFETRLNKYVPFIVRLFYGLKYIIGFDEPTYGAILLLSKENRLNLGNYLLGSETIKTKKEKAAIIPRKPRKARVTKATLSEENSSVSISEAGKKRFQTLAGIIKEEKV